jgi:multidrug efflux pump subunit AcrB
VLENVARKKREAREAADAPGDAPGDAGDEGGARDARFAPAHAAVQEVTGSVIAGTGANLASVLPFLLVSGLAALLFRELILVITYSTLAAVALALTLVPAIAARLDEPDPDDAGGGRLQRWSEKLFGPARRFNAWLAERYAAGLTRAIGRRAIVLLGAALLFGGSIFVARGLGTEFLPQFDDGRADVQIRFAPGVALEEADQATEAVERVIARMPSLSTQFAVAGGRLFSRAAQENSTESRIDIQLDAERELTTQEWIGQLRGRLADLPLPGARVLVRKTNVRGLGGRPGSSNSDVELILSGDDLAQLSTLGDQLVAAAREVPGLTGVEKSLQDGVPEYRVQVDRERAAALGVTASDVGQAVRVALDGVVASTFTESDNEYDIRVRMDRSTFGNAGDLEALPVGSLGGVPLPLGAVARVRESTGPVEIQREDQARVVRITGDVAGEGQSVGEVSQAAERRLRQVRLPAGYRLTVGGEAEEAAENQKQLLLVLLMAVLLVFAVMAVQYESVINPLVIMVTVPLALTGVVAALWVTKTPLSAPVLLGVVLLAGIVVNNGIILIEYVEELRRGEGLKPEDAVVRAGQLRLRPILMTAITALLGSLPLALGIEKGGETLRPLAIAFVGGLGVATLLTLFVVPSLYLLAHRWRDAAAARVAAWRGRRRTRHDARSRAAAEA